MSKRNLEAIYPLSPMQQGMLFHSLMAPGSGVYVEQTSVILRGALDIAAFEEAWRQVTRRHAVLRTGFVWKSVEQPVQVVQREVAIPIERQDWRGLSAAEQADRLERHLRDDRARGFDLARAPLMRMALMQIAADAAYFVWSHHHLLLDGWSLPLLLGEVFTLYEGLRRGQRPELPPTRAYRDYIAWLQRQDKGQAERFWRQLLADIAAPTPLGARLPVGAGLGAGQGQPEHATYTRWLSAETTARLGALGREQQLTLSTIVQGAWAILLSRYSREEDVVFGVTVSGRPPEMPGVETMVGLFINTLPVRVPVPAAAELAGWLRALQDLQSELSQYEQTPLVEIQGWSEVPRGAPLFESILVFENYPVGEAVREWQFSLAIEGLRTIEQTNYPLTLSSAPGERLPLTISFDLSRFDAATIERMLGHLATLLEGIAAGPGQSLGALSMLSATERELIIDWNATARPFPSEHRFHELVSDWATKHPDAIAVRWAGQTLSYAELDARANQLAHLLRGRGVTHETIVGVCQPRTAELIIAFLAVLKAGGTYLPLDPDYPAERLAFMLEDTAAPLVLTHSAVAAALPATAATTLLLDQLGAELGREPITPPPDVASAASLAYVIYTSGSTGQPKGVLLHHRGLVNFVHFQIENLAVTPESRVLQFSALGFDASMAEIGLALAAGACLVLAPRETLTDGVALQDLLHAEAVTLAILPPAMLAALPDTDLPALATLITAGEGCSPAVARRWMAGRQLVNGYGPTEVTIGPSILRIDTLAEDLAALPIGGPMPNTTIYILDREGTPAPIGVAGELCIGGVGVARGYLNRPALTDEKFVPDPFSATPGARMYRSGDLGRWREDGTIEFLGRIDQQVKIRGYRIELGEIEAALSAQPALHDAVVLAREDTPGARRLVAYVVPAAADAAPGELVTILRESLGQRLPAYMVPAAFVLLDALPRSPAGKIDRRALPAPDSDSVVLERYVAPRTPGEEILAGIWARVLGVDRVGVHDDFFALGGHSLLATQVVARVREVFGVEIALRSLFEQPTVAALAAQIRAARPESDDDEAPLLPAARDGDPEAGSGQAPLSYAQQRLWFLDQLEAGSPLYSLPQLVLLKGALDPQLLEQSLALVVARHESLRTVFVSAGGEPRQLILPLVQVHVPIYNLREHTPAAREAELRRLAARLAEEPFDLQRGPLLRVCLFQLAENEHALLLNMHHIVSDGWSLGVLVNELAGAYAALAAGRAPSLPQLAVQYADFAIWQRDLFQGAALERQLDYWRRQLAGAPALIDLPTDRPRPSVQSHRGAHASFTLTPELTAALRALSQQEGVTLFMTLLAAYMTLLGRYSRQEDFCVGTPIAGRTRRELESLIGFFVNTLVLRGDLAGNPTFRELLRRVREVTLGAYEHQDLPFEMLVEALKPERSLSYSPLFQVMFVLDNTPPPHMDLPGLSVTGAEAEGDVARFDLTLEMREIDGALFGSLEYNVDLFDAATAARMAAHFQSLLDAIVAAPASRVGDLAMLTPAERQQILVDWNATATPFPDDRCAHWLFEEWADRQPDAPALRLDGQTLTYGELDRRANQLAHYLHDLGVGPGALVGVATERSFEQIVAVLGVMKAGGAFVPLDPGYPAERLAFMVEDAGLAALITQRGVDYRAWLSDTSATNGHALPITQLDSDWGLIATRPLTRPEQRAGAGDLAYVIYTSGSTGRPKGALLAHRGLCNLSAAQQRAFAITPGKRVLQFSPFSFDASVWETVMALANGATLVLARQEQLASGPALLRLLREQAITTVTLPPSLLAVLEPGELPELVTVIAAGEACSAELVARWAPGRRFFNAYGPTETTVCASMHLCDPNDPQSPPIGRPIANFQLYILDHAGAPVPVGVPGELHIGGVGLARGYHSRPELTTEKFIADPFSQRPGARLYRSGDLARYRPDGSVEFLGRVDHQVKLRGFRIELGEIEAVLRSHPAVQDAAALVREDTPGHQRLVGYVITEPGAAPGEPAALAATLREHLRGRLPEYMLPAAFVALERWPLSPSGKIDRRALPAPDGAGLIARPPYVAPRDERETTIAAICAELLGLERVGIHDNFFDLGGHSLLATRLIARVQAELGYEIALRSLFEQPTVAGMSAVIGAAQSEGASSHQQILELLESIEELSEDDVRSLLS